MRKNESGSVHATISGVLVIAVVSALGFLFWQNIINKPKLENSVSNSKQKQEATAVKGSSAQIGEGVKSVDTSQYFVISEWNVRFEVPDILKDTTISLYSGSGVGYPGKGLVTTRMKKDPGCGEFVNVTIYRRDKNVLYEPTGYEFLKQDSIDGYWYSTSSSHAYTNPEKNTSCTNPSVVAKDATALWAMLDTIEATPKN